MIDAHCHLGEVLDKTRSTDLQSVLEGESSSPEDFELEYLISNQCFKNYWRSRRGMDRLARDRRVYFPVGLHPRFIMSHPFKDRLRQMEELLQHLKVLAIGEVGLDFSDPNVTENHQAEQQRALGLVSLLANKYQLPVVIHARGQESNPRCLEILKRTLSPQHKIHVHCFSGTDQESRDWLEAFPNAVFGVPAKVGAAMTWAR